MNVVRKLVILFVFVCSGCGEHAQQTHDAEMPTGVCGYNLVQRDARYLIFFDSNSASFSPRSKTILGELMQNYRRLGSDGTLVLRGNIDSAELIGSPSLDLKRADAVRIYLISQGFPEGSISIAGDGVAYPFVPSAAGVSEGQNRYVNVMQDFGRQLRDQARARCAAWVRSSCMNDHPTGSLQACERGWDYLAPATR